MIIGLIVTVSEWSTFSSSSSSPTYGSNTALRTNLNSYQGVSIIGPYNPNRCLIPVDCHRPCGDELLETDSHRDVATTNCHSSFPANLPSPTVYASPDWITSKNILVRPVQGLHSIVSTMNGIKQDATAAQTMLGRATTIRFEWTLCNLKNLFENRLAHMLYMPVYARGRR